MSSYMVKCIVSVNDLVLREVKCNIVNIVIQKIKSKFYWFWVNICYIIIVISEDIYFICIKRSIILVRYKQGISFISN